MKVSVLGWYGHGNLGDEAMLEGIQYLCEKQFGPCTFTVMSDAAFSLDKANESGLFILGGGELINRDRLFLVNRVAWDKDITTRKIILGCGLNNADYASLQDHVKRSLRRFDAITVRDTISYRLLKEDPKLADKVCLSPDPSCVLASKYGITWQPMEGVAAVVPTDRTEAKRKVDEGILTTNIVEQTKAHLKQQLLNGHIRLVILLAFGGDDNDDLASCRQLEEYLKDTFTVRIVKPKTPKEALELLSACSKVYSYRLHGLVLAHSLGIPFAGYGYHRKIQRVHDTLMGEAKPEMFQDTTPTSEWVPFENRPLGWFTLEEGKLYADTVAQHPKGIVVELGVYMGRSLSFILDQDVTIYAVDIWDTIACPPDPRTYPPVELGLFMGNLHRMNVPPGKVHAIQLDSVAAARLFDNESVDVILVDSFHTEEHTCREIEAWWPKLKVGGDMLFHDFDIGRRNDPNRGTHVLEAVEAKFGKVDKLIGTLALVQKR